MKREMVNLAGWFALTAAGLNAGAGCSEKKPDRAEAERVAVQPTGAPLVAVQTAQVAAQAPRPTEPLAPGTSCTSSGCHSSFGAEPFVHGVLLANESCSICHEEDQGGHVFPLKRPGQAGCTYCHQSVVGQKVHEHGAVLVESACVLCHDPHASQNGSLLRAPVASLCADCHPPESFSHPHGPFGSGECTACHDPHESDFVHLLRGGEGANHCYLCHDEMHAAMASAKQIHAPAGQDCQICHRPHGSDFPAVLKQPIDQTCLACHTDIEQMIEGAESPHGALTMNSQCANCHDAHVSSWPNLLKDRQDVLCLQCHDNPITANDGRTIPDMTASIRGRKFLHGPVESGNCSACHNIHGSSHSRLLRQNFTEAFYSSFDLKQYALCFECHESALVTDERTTALTDFRDGDLNLHYVHVNREQKGRTCRACHEMHGSNQPSQIADAVPFEGSGWALPIGFRKTDTGGSCAPGCHKPMSYSRIEVNPLPKKSQ